MLVRLILIGVAVAAAIYLLRLVLSPRRERSAPPTRTGGDSQIMVKCEHCGLHVPQDEAVYGDGRPYCSETHRARNLP